MNPYPIIVAAIVAVLSLIFASQADLGGLTAIGVEFATAKKLPDGALESTVPSDILQRLGGLANLAFSGLVTAIGWFRGVIHSIAESMQDAIEAKRAPSKQNTSDDTEDSEDELPELADDRKELIEGMLLEAIYSRNKRDTILWAHRLAGSEYLTQPQPAAPTEPPAPEAVPAVAGTVPATPGVK